MHPALFGRKAVHPDLPAFGLWSFSIVTHQWALIVGPYADNPELSYTTTLSYTTNTILHVLGYALGDKSIHISYLRVEVVEKPLKLCQLATKV